jgi:hypothetical protein
MPAVGGADVAALIGFGDQAFVTVKVERGAGGAVGREGLADDLFDATTEGVVGVLGNSVAIGIRRFNQPFAGTVGKALALTALPDSRAAGVFRRDSLAGQVAVGIKGLRDLGGGEAGSRGGGGGGGSELLWFAALWEMPESARG